MKKLLIILGIFLTACQEETIEPNSPQECECFKYNQEMQAGGNWYDLSMDAYPEGTCDDDSTIVQQTMMTRYIIRCQ
jgi:hypothetical protein